MTGQSPAITKAIEALEAAKADLQADMARIDQAIAIIRNAGINVEPKGQVIPAALRRDWLRYLADNANQSAVGRHS